MTRLIDINCDLGEGMPDDAAIMPFISSANISCGYHAGDADTMARTIELCTANHVNIGAHPSFADRHNFGRTEMKLGEDELYQIVSDQLQIMENACTKASATLHHVKPHGALYNMAAYDQTMARVVVRAVKDFNKELIIYGLSNSQLIREAEKAGMKSMNEVFADRNYDDDGRLIPRIQANALITETNKMIHHVMGILKHQILVSVNGKKIPMQADTICIHGDGIHALSFAKSLYKTFKQEKIWN